MIKENSIYSVESIKEILDVFIHSISKMQVKNIDLTDEKYKYLSTVDSINDLVMQGNSFREAYMEIGKKVQGGSYEPGNSIKHTHTGSKDNLALDEIEKKRREAGEK